MQVPAYTYEIQVQFHLSQDWAASIPARLTLCYSPAGLPISTIAVSVQDQAELIGILNELHGHGMRILSVRDEFFLGPGAFPDGSKQRTASVGDLHSLP